MCLMLREQCFTALGSHVGSSTYALMITQWGSTHLELHYHQDRLAGWFECLFIALRIDLVLVLPPATLWPLEAVVLKCDALVKDVQEWAEVVFRGGRISPLVHRRTDQDYSSSKPPSKVSRSSTFSQSLTCRSLFSIPLHELHHCKLEHQRFPQQSP